MLLSLSCLRLCSIKLRISETGVNIRCTCTICTRNAVQFIQLVKPRTVFWYSLTASVALSALVEVSSQTCGVVVVALARLNVVLFPVRRATNCAAVSAAEVNLSMNACTVRRCNGNQRLHRCDNLSTQSLTGRDHAGNGIVESIRHLRKRINISFHVLEDS